MWSTADRMFKEGGDGLWGEGKSIRRKMNSIGGESRLRPDPQRKEQTEGCCNAVGARGQQMENPDTDVIRRTQFFFLLMQLRAHLS